jgi:hypothetical protein
MFDYIIIDEAQDTSDQQAEILWTLAERTGNVIFCGDVDQSMYAFRGAVPEVLRGDFEAHWNAVQRFNLPVNYRSTQSIVRAAAQLINSNYMTEEDQHYLKPFAHRQDAPAGVPVSCTITSTFEVLCSTVVEMVKDTEPSDWFILSRTRAECAQLHTALITAGIPAINKVGGLLFGAPHIRKVLAYARLACDYNGARDDLDILKEIANVATSTFRAPLTRRRHLQNCHNDKPWVNCGCPMIYEEGIDYCHARYYGEKAIEEAGGWEGILQHVEDRNRGGYMTLKAKAATDLVEFVLRLERKADNALATLQCIIMDCVLPWMQAEEGVDTDDLAENGKEEEFAVLMNTVEPQETLEQYLRRIDELGQSDTADDAAAVLVGTYHWSPIIPPQQRPGALPCGRPATDEEERRLAFVGITRAKDAAHVVQALEWNGAVLKISPYIAEMDLQTN